MNTKAMPGSGSLMMTGVVYLVLGLLCLISPAGAGSMVVNVIALVLMVTGVVQVIQSIRVARESDTLLAAVLGLVVAGLGVMVWMNPDLGSGFLTLLLMVFFAVHGGWKALAAWRMRRARGWGWLMMSGLLSLLFVYLLWRQWPLSGAWAIGVLIGVDLLSTGLVMIMLSMAMKRVRRMSTGTETIQL